jgi:AraC family transcriptional regulator
MNPPAGSPVERALWFIESHFGSEITLGQISEVACVSRYHMSRMFAVTMGIPVMRYLRVRRLSQAARALASGAPDILSLALDVGYGSHEAFSRAFRDEFGVTPESVRTQGHFNNLRLMEAKTMEGNMLQELETRFETGRVLLISGIGSRYNCENTGGIAAQWQGFVPHIGHITGQVNSKAYGVMSSFDEQGNFDYTCGVEVKDFSQVSPDWNRLRLPAQDYAVFTHCGHISTIRSTWTTIWNGWLPESGREVEDAPNFELYGENFDSVTGRGRVEIWLPLKRER